MFEDRRSLAAPPGWVGYRHGSQSGRIAGAIAFAKLFAHWMHQFEKSPVDCEAIRAFPEPRKCYSKRCRFAESFQQRTSGAALDVGSMQDVHATLIRKRLLCPSTDTASRLNAVARPYLIRVRRPGHYLHAGSRSVAAAYSLRPSGVRCLRASK